MKNDAGLRRVPRFPRLILGLLLLSQVLVAAIWLLAGWRWGLLCMAISHLVVVWATLYPRATLFLPALSRLPTPRAQVWLTIDDGPSDDTLPMLDLLDSHQARATFFVVGDRAQARPELIREIQRRGHGLGNHSASHPDRWFWALGPRRLEQEIAATQRILSTITGQVPIWFRSVVGMTNPFVGLALHRHQLTRIAWSARGFDGVNCTPSQVIARIERGLSPGAIVLLHEGAKHGHNVEILRACLELLRVRGLRTVAPGVGAGSRGV